MCNLVHTHLSDVCPDDKHYVNLFKITFIHFHAHFLL